MEASRPLSELASLLPSACSASASAPVTSSSSLSGRSETRRLALEASAARDSWLWSQRPGVEDEDAAEGGGGGDGLLGIDLGALSSAIVQSAAAIVPFSGGGGAAARQAAASQAVDEALKRCELSMILG
jgi:hypothetical protein